MNKHVQMMVAQARKQNREALTSTGATKELLLEFRDLNMKHARQIRK